MGSFNALWHTYTDTHAGASIDTESGRTTQKVGASDGERERERETSARLHVDIQTERRASTNQWNRVTEGHD